MRLCRIVRNGNGNAGENRLFLWLSGLRRNFVPFLLSVVVLQFALWMDGTTAAADGAIVKEYRLATTEEIHSTLLQWNESYPNLIRVETSQARFGLSRAGGTQDCPFDVDADGCLNYFFTLSDFVRHPEGSRSSQALPSVLLSGSLHGNERVGPTSVMETAALLLEAATCEALPSQRANELPMAHSCRQDLSNRGISPGQRQWIARLLSTRRIVVVPTANALGYYRNQREEANIDPNRDFPYDVLNPSLCMRTIAGRTLNELYRQHIFQTSFTFHGGTELIGYEWGNPSWYNDASPDDIAQNQLAAAYSKYGGRWSGHPRYQYGIMNDIIYYVRGGMEDWAYAGSWDSQHMIQCLPSASYYGGYPASKTQYDGAMLRSFNMLVETSDRKNPLVADLGTNYQLLNPKNNESTFYNPGNGHVPRNLRLSMASIDLVEPYVSFRGVDDLTLSEDVIPLMENPTCSSQAPVVSVPASSLVELKWTVGGAIQIDSTQLWIADDLEGQNLDAFFDEIWTDCQLQPTLENVKSLFRPVPTSIQSGRGFFSSSGVHPEPSDDDNILGPVFTTTLNMSGITEMVVLASARVDSSWADLPTDRRVSPSNVPPQSHIVNVRTNPNWSFQSTNGNFVQGRLDWFSIPLYIVVSHEDDRAKELTNRFNTFSSQPSMSPSVFEPSMYPTSLVNTSTTALINTSWTVEPSFTVSSSATEVPSDLVTQESSDSASSDASSNGTFDDTVFGSFLTTQTTTDRVTSKPTDQASDSETK